MPLKFKSKIGQNKAEIRRTLKFERGLLYPVGSRVLTYLFPRALHRLNVFLGREIQVLDAPDFNGDTPLHIAVKVESIEICEMLLKAGVRPNKHNHDGFTPLDTAQMKKFDSIAQLLKSYGALPSGRR